MSSKRRKWTLRFLVAAAVGLALPFLPELLSQGTGPSVDLSSRLGLAGGVSAGTFAILFLAGVLTSLTPCVYPLIPITVSVFGARKADKRARSIALSATYVAGIAAMYSGLGLFAALSGRAFGSALSSPIVLGVLALFLFALAASMFGAFEIAVPSSLVSKVSGVRGAGFPSAFAMGLVAGVVAAPCTGPVLAGVLAYVATTRSMMLGFWMLFTYAVGVGLLFFVLGATTVKLPRSGAWMDTVKSVLGLALVAAGIGLLLPFLPQPRALPWTLRTIAIASGVLAFAAVLAGALRLTFHEGGRAAFTKAASLLVLLLAVSLRFGWAGAPKPGAAAEIAWLRDEGEAVAQARATGKPLLVDFGATWCAACMELDKHTFSDPLVRQEVTSRFVPLRVDATDETDEVTRLEQKYGVPGLPTVLMMACKDAPPQPKPGECAVPQDGPGRIAGFVPPQDMLERMRRIQ